MRMTARHCARAIVLALLAITPAVGQLTDEIPHASYYAGVQAFYAGEVSPNRAEIP